MTSLDLTVRPLRDDDLPAVVQLLQDTFGTWPHVQTSAGPVEYLRWKTRSGPGAMQRQVIAEADGRVIGSRLYILQRVLILGQSKSAQQTVDLCVSPTRQGAGTYRAMRRFAVEEMKQAFDIRFGFTDHPAVHALDQRDGGVTLGNEIEKLVCALDGSQNFAGSPRTPWTLSQPTSLDERMDEFWVRAAGPYDFILDRSAAYLNWRYCDRRAGDFTVKQAEQDHEIVGFAAYRTALGTGYIADLLALPGRLDVARALLSQALEELQKANVSSVECWIPTAHPYGEILREAGFEIRKRSVAASFVALRLSLDAIRFLQDPGAAVHLTLGDSDLV